MNNIYITSVGGLGNRLKNLVSGMIMSEILSYPLFVHWIINDHLGCSFDDLFESPNIQPIPKDDLKRLNELLSIPPNKSWELLIDNNIVRPDTVSENEKKIICSYFNKLLPTKRIRDKIKIAMDTFDITNRPTIGIHYRYDSEWCSRSDIAKAIENGKEFHELFIMKINQYTPDTQFFISSSNNNELSKFLHLKNIMKIDKSIETNLDHRKKNRNLISMIDAVVDLYILSACQEIIITPSSTFSECAWYIGGCKAKRYNPIIGKYV